MNVAIVGASGYGGGELLRLLLQHPDVTVTTAVSETYAGKPVSAAFPGLAKRTELTFTSYGDGTELAQCDVVFLAQENGKAMTSAPHLLEAGCKVVDLSADFRFRDVTRYEAWYGTAHKASEWSARAVYGLPEIHGEALRKAQIVGNPGCYTTASILALAPALQHRLLDVNTLVIDGKSGVSGAGRAKYAQEYHYSERNESATAYKIAGTHRHTPEIEQELSAVAGQDVKLSFTPHLVPMTRGILVSCYAALKEPISTEGLRELYRKFYAEAPFVFVTDGIPETKHTCGSNACHIGLAVDTRTNRITVLSAIDNLIKGAAGQAIQNMNLMCGFEETAGLDFGGIWP
jgi:N-acetyl-gamma-glutamyl-phosphate reductase